MQHHSFIYLPTGTRGPEVTSEASGESKGGVEWVFVASELYEQGQDMLKYSEREVLFWKARLFSHTLWA